MVERLAALAHAAQPVANPYLNAARASILERRLASISNPAEQIPVRVEYAQELLRAGETLTAIRELQQVEAVVRVNPHAFREPFPTLLRDLLAIAYLRMGEQDNCLHMHASESCLVPIAGSGIHQNQRGSRAAIRAYTAAVRERPGDLATRWLLNLAYMTVGEYPEGVPEAWRIPPAAFASAYDVGRFTEVAGPVGLGVVGLAGGCVMEDFDRDGFLDIMASSWGLEDQLRYFRNSGEGTFVEQTAEAGLLGLTGGLNLLHADYDNDGDADVLVLRGAWLAHEGRHPNSLLENTGGGIFVDVTERAGLLSFHPTQTAAWGDYDNDGWLDLFIGNESGNEAYRYSGEPREAATPPDQERERHPCELYRNNGDGTFAEVAARMGLAHDGFVKGVVWGDYDNDGDLDLYLSQLGAPNALYRNEGSVEGEWKFTEVAAQAGVLDPLASFPVWFWDYDNDGWLDLFVGGYASTSVDQIAALYLGLPVQSTYAHLYRNRGDGTFENVTKISGADRVLLAMGANFGDIDNDGWLDCYVGNGSPNFRMLLPNIMLRNAGNGTFQDVTAAAGVGNIQKGHGVAFGDVDNDGDQDIYQVMGGAYAGDVYPNTLFQNPGHRHHWLTLQFEGVRANRAGIGARIAVTIETPSDERTIHRLVGTGGSFGSASLQEEIGLGDAVAVRSIQVRWPGSETPQVFRDVAMDRCWIIREGALQLREGQLRPVRLAPAMAPAIAPAIAPAP